MQEVARNKRVEMHENGKGTLFLREFSKLCVFFIITVIAFIILKMRSNGVDGISHLLGIKTCVRVECNNCIFG